MYKRQIKGEDIADDTIESRKLNLKTRESVITSMSLDSTWRKITDVSIYLETDSFVLIKASAAWVQSYNGGKLVAFAVERNYQPYYPYHWYSYWLPIDAYDAIPFSVTYITAAPAGWRTFSLWGSMPWGGSGYVGYAMIKVISLSHASSSTDVEGSDNLLTSTELAQFAPKPPSGEQL